MNSQLCFIRIDGMRISCFRYIHIWMQRALNYSNGEKSWNEHPGMSLVGFVFAGGKGDLGTVLNGLLVHCSACIHSYKICRSMVTSCRQIIYPCHKTFIPSLWKQNKEKYNILRENEDGPNLHNSMWNKILKNKDHKIIKQNKVKRICSPIGGKFAKIILLQVFLVFDSWYLLF